MELAPEYVVELRKQFPALSRTVDGREAVYLDGPAGTQVPQRVIDAMVDYLTRCNANHDGAFITSVESDRMLAEAHQAVADLLGADDPDTVCFGANMTTLTFAVSRAIARTWREDDEVVVTRLDHDANIMPWVLAARDVGAKVRWAGVRTDDATLDLDDVRRQINARTRLVAVGCASNASGSVNPVETITRWAHDAGALVFLDAVHYAPHRLIDVAAWDCDLLACSAYKFFGPHVGMLWGKRPLLKSLEAYKVRPAPDTLPGKWMTGTQNHEGIAGTLAAIDYLADLGRDVALQPSATRREALRCAYRAIADYERMLVERLLAGLAELDDVTVWGVTDPDRLDERLPTVSITHGRLPAAEVARRLGERGIFAWHGNYYALALTEALDLEPDGMVRLGLVHYNTPAEVDRVLATLAETSNSD